MSMPENQDDDDAAFHALMTAVAPIKGAGAHVSQRSTTPLEIRLRHDPDHFLAHHHQARRGTPETEKSHRQIDGRTRKRLKQGKIHISARLDLHGYRYDQARTALRHFIASEAQNGARCVLVVTGKGDIDRPGDAPSTRGVIRRSLPDWLLEPPLDHLVLDTAPAKDKDGGAGAVYLYLRSLA